jgi:MoaA/NifB/PqqE/SkfB family radical SAM enzyme/glutaredoxin-related protein
MNLNSNTDGSVKICCAQNENIHLKKEDGTTYNLYEDDINEIWNSKNIQGIRKKLLEGEQIQECNVCWNVENANKTYGGHNAPMSTRQDTIRSYMEDDGIFSWAKDSIVKNIQSAKDYGWVNESLKSLELRLGNHCNLQCNMCWGYSSSKINSERLTLLKNRDKTMPEWLFEMWYPSEYDISKIDMMWHENDKFLENFKKIAPTLKRLYVTGGEPSIIEANTKIINHLIDIGNKKCHVSFTTNLTTWNLDLYEKLEFFDRSEVQVSIDGFGKSQEYIRYGSNWGVIEDNFKKLIQLPDKVRIQIYTVFQIYNMFETYKMMKWLDSLRLDGLLNRKVGFYPILIDQPLYLRTNLMQWEIRDSAMKLYREFYDYSTYDNEYLDFHGAANKIISYLENDWEPHASYGKYCQGVEQTEINQRKMFYQYTYYMDAVRNTDFFKTFIEFRDLKKEFNDSIEDHLVVPNWWLDDKRLPTK